MNDYKNEQLDEVNEELDFDEQQRQKHERDHTDLLHSYTQYQISALECKNCYKGIFFLICLVLLAFPMILTIILSIALYRNCMPNYAFEMVTIIIGSMASFAVNTIVLPKTIAEYFFNKEEDKNIIQLFSNAQKHDQYQSDKGDDRQAILMKILKK